MKVTYWLYKNLDLKMINYSMGGSTGYTKEPISFEEGVGIPATVLEVPFRIQGKVTSDNFMTIYSRFL